jgi:predicted enzyme related to lactoylglutathione lyase
MDDLRLSAMLTRRAALFLGAAATQLSAQKSGDKPMGRPVVHFEIGCRDKEKTSHYFSQLFGWNITPAGPAHNIDTGAAGAISGHITSLGHEPHNYTMFYVEVEDVQTSLNKAVELGGKKIVGPVSIPTGTFAWFADPDGNMIGLVKSNP